MNDVYLIPANANRGRLIFGIFRKEDLILFSIGVGISLLLLMMVPLSSTLVTVLVLAPAAISTLLVAPVPYYHNILNVIKELLEFINNRQKYVWRGWCANNGEETNK